MSSRVSSGFSSSFCFYDPSPPPLVLLALAARRAFWVTSCSAVKETNGAEKYWEMWGGGLILVQFMFHVVDTRRLLSVFSSALFVLLTFGGETPSLWLFKGSFLQTHISEKSCFQKKHVICSGKIKYMSSACVNHMLVVTMDQTVGPTLKHQCNNVSASDCKGLKKL